MVGRVDTVLTIYDAVKNTLVISGLREETAKKYASFACEVYDYVEAHPSLQTALKGAKSTYEGATSLRKYQAASKLAANAAEMNSLEYAERFAAQGKASAGGAISAFVDYFCAVAKGLGIEMNECAIAVTKTTLDVLTTAALIDSGVGLCLLGLQYLTLKADRVELMQACFTPG